MNKTFLKAIRKKTRLRNNFLFLKHRCKANKRVNNVRRHRSVSLVRKEKRVL